jgi:N-acetyl-beta-hexosaminidase
VATAAGVASAAATIGTSIAQATKKASGQKIEAPPTIANAQDEQIKVKARARRGLRYNDTIISQAISGGLGGSPFSGGKTQLGA